MSEVCKEWDEYLSGYAANRPIWIVKLSNNETVYQDDGRPGVKTPSAWLRLKSYCEKHNLRITEMHIHYRSHIEHIGSDFDGYYFCKGAGGFLFSDITVSSFVIGTLSGDVLNVSHWKLPELIVMQTETRNRNENEECLIEKPIVEAGRVTCSMPAQFKKQIFDWLIYGQKKNE